MSDNPYRLPRHVLPTHYDLRLEPSLETWTFDGHVAIDVSITEQIDELVLNAADIEILSAELKHEAGEIAVADIVYDDEYERATLRLHESAEAGEYRLRITYTGVINDQLRGLYRSSFKDPDGQEHGLATSQCQSTDARRIFPCWDEPDMKATFQTTMVVAEGLEAYSNAGEIERTSTDNGRVEIAFGKTMKMSTYLLAFIVGPFEATEPRVVRDVPIRIIVPKGNLHLTDVAMDNAVFCFEYLSDYYGIPYPGDKLDHIGIPDFAAGAMENVGLITYRDAYLVIDKDKASQGELQNSLDVIGHEIAHQWFGNLVTMKWWEGAWLNEAFASFMEFKATDAMRPEWKRWLSFAAAEIPWAMGTDQLSTTRPIEFEVNSPTEVDEMFDAITYGKGSAVLWMMEQFIGTEQFRKGVGSYLRKHSYANTVTTDLWEGLDGASDWPVGEIMDTWVYQRGFPQIDAEVTDGKVRIRQRRYLAIPDESDATIWKIPVQLRGVADGDPFETKVLLDTDEVITDVGGNVDYVVANAGGHGFYRTRYSEETFAGILANLADLDDIERYTLVSDTWAFVRSGQVTAAAFLDLVGAFTDETEHAIWSIILGGLGAIEHHALDESTRPNFAKYVRGLVGPALDRIGWEPAEDDTDLERKLRGSLIVAMGNLGADQDTITRARDIAEQVLAGVEFDPEVTTAALAVYARNGADEEYETLW
ncbi:MAG: M1 family metallopeptidase, partial [Acidimicrobiia bacterium]